MSILQMLKNYFNPFSATARDEFERLKGSQQVAAVAAAIFASLIPLGFPTIVAFRAVVIRFTEKNRVAHEAEKTDHMGRREVFSNKEVQSHLTKATQEVIGFEKKLEEIKDVEAKCTEINKFLKANKKNLSQDLLIEYYMRDAELRISRMAELKSRYPDGMARLRLLECLKLKHMPALLLLEKYYTEYETLRLDAKGGEFIEGMLPIAQTAVALNKYEKLSPAEKTDEAKLKPIFKKMAEAAEKGEGLAAFFLLRHIKNLEMQEKWFEIAKTSPALFPILEVVEEKGLKDWFFSLSELEIVDGSF